MNPGAPNGEKRHLNGHKAPRTEQATFRKSLIRNPLLARFPVVISLFNRRKTLGMAALITRPLIHGQPLAHRCPKGHLAEALLLSNHAELSGFTASARQPDAPGIHLRASEKGPPAAAWRRRIRDRSTNGRSRPRPAPGRRPGPPHGRRCSPRTQRMGTNARRPRRAQAPAEPRRMSLWRSSHSIS